MLAGEIFRVSGICRGSLRIVTEARDRQSGDSIPSESPKMPRVAKFESIDLISEGELPTFGAFGWNAISTLAVSGFCNDPKASPTDARNPKDSPASMPLRDSDPSLPAA